MEQRKPADNRKRVKNEEPRFAMVASTLQGLEEVLAGELRSIGGNDVRVGKRAVFFTADKDLVYKANLRLRTALRLLMPIKRFRAEDEDVLYNQVKAIAWDDLFDLDKTFLIRTTTSGPVFTHSHYVALKCKDAIADFFRDKYGSRPSVDSREPDIVIHVKIWNDDVTISLDSSGDPLNKRGYRQREAIAPLNECLAAGMLLIAGYDGKTDFIDAMCGSGTLCIEAAMIAHRIAPGLMRDNFAFMHWKDYDEELFEVIREATVNRLREESINIVGMDTDFFALDLARQAAKDAGLEDAIDFRIGNFFKEEPPKPPAILIMNPPYDERIKVDDIEKLYANIGDRLKEAYAGRKAWILSGHVEAMKRIGLRTFDTHHLMNGKIPCRFSGYRLFSGSGRES